MISFTDVNNSAVNPIHTELSKHLPNKANGYLQCDSIIAYHSWKSNLS